MYDSPSSASSSTQGCRSCPVLSPFSVDDPQSSHMIKRISDFNAGRKLQNDYTFEVCKHLHHLLSRSLSCTRHQHAGPEQLQNHLRKNVGDFTLFLKNHGQSCDNSVSMKRSCHALAPLRLPSHFQTLPQHMLSHNCPDKDPETIDLNEPRHAQYMHKVWKRHQNAVCWVDINLPLKIGLKFYQTRTNAIILHEHFQLVVFRKLFGTEAPDVCNAK